MSQKSLIFIFLFSVFIGNKISLFAENDTNKVQYQLKGFIKSDIIFDSRQTVSAREGFVVLYPAKSELDASGKDKNEGPILNQYAASSRVIFEINQIKSESLKYKAYIETDFTGSSNATYNGLRLRHAYLKLDYYRWQFLAGQYWHPLVAEEVFPDMIGLNLGNPIKSAMRCPQIRVSCNITNTIKATISATSQLDNASIGEAGISSLYMRNSAVPNVNAQFQYKKNNVAFGIMADYKNLLFSKVDSVFGLINSNCPSTAFSIYGKFENNVFMFKSQLLYGGNLYEHAMLGGIAGSSDNPNKFIPINTASVWTNIYYKSKKWNLGFFAGYIQNMGADSKINGKIYGRGNDVQSVARFAPQFLYKASSKFMIFSETEWTQAKFGVVDEYGTVNNSKPTSNIRENISLIMIF